MKQSQVVHKFAELPGAYFDGEGDKLFVYIPGHRKDRTLMIAHCDTVFEDIPIKLGQKSTKEYPKSLRRLCSIQKDTEWEKPSRYANVVTKRKGIGIGADDRAGCAILFALRNLGHSILLTSGEEKGCLTSRWMMEDDYWKNELQKHNFAIQFDRRNGNDIVFYNVATKTFVAWVEKQTKYVTTNGTNTDVRIVCKDICGFNISVGFYNEHTPNEELDIPEWERTLKTCYNLLRQKDLPKFKFDSSDLYYKTYNNNYNNTSSTQNYQGMGTRPTVKPNVHKSTHQKPKQSKTKKSSKNEQQKSIDSFLIKHLNHRLQCSTCNAFMTEEDLICNHFMCNKCHAVIVAWQ